MRLIRTSKKKKRSKNSKIVQITFGYRNDAKNRRIKE